MDLRKLKTLIDLVSESNTSEREITEADGKVRIVKADPAAAVIQHNYVPAQQMVAAQPAPVLAAAPVAEAPDETGHVGKAPMVGTFYRTPTPAAKTFANVGMAIKEGEPICIIEAMKIM